MGWMCQEGNMKGKGKREKGKGSEYMRMITKRRMKSER
jgi:hypothetical protein